MSDRADCAGPATRPRVVLAICCLGLFLYGMDITIVNVALPAIRSDLHASVAGLQWSIDGYTVVLASFYMLGGSTADRFGGRRTFQAGLALFTLGSLLCSLAPHVLALVCFRMCQALGGSMLNPVAMSILVTTFPERKERAAAIGVWGAVLGIAMAIGPIVGGIMVEAVGWRSIFWINVPIGVTAITLTARFLPDSRPETRSRVDVVGQLLIVVALASFTSAVIEGRRLGWSSGIITGGFAVALVSTLAFVKHEARQPCPLIDVRFFRSVPFSSATLVGVIAFGAFSGFMFLSSLYLQEGRSLGARDAGFCMFPIALAQFVCSPFAGRLVGAGRLRLALVVAGTLIAGGGLLLTGLHEQTPILWVLLAYSVFGGGIGMVNPPLTYTAVSAMPRGKAGLAAAIASTSRQVGATVGVAVTGSIAGSGIQNAHSLGFAASTHPVWWLVVGCGLGIVVLGVASTSALASLSASRVARLLDPQPVAEGKSPQRGS